MEIITIYCSCIKMPMQGLLVYITAYKNVYSPTNNPIDKIFNHKLFFRR